jgi:hypothetical protein
MHKTSLIIIIIINPLSISASQHLSMNLRHLGRGVFVKKTQNIHTYLHARSCDALPELFFLSSWLIAWSEKKKKKKYYSGRRRSTTNTPAC